MLTHILRAESQRFQLVCVADCFLREIEFSVLFLCLCVPLFAAIRTSMQKHCCCARRPTGVAMVTAVITEPVLLTDVNTGKRILSFSLSEKAVEC